LIAALFLAVMGTAIYLLLRFRQAPTIYWLTAALIALSLVENHYIGNSCEGGCSIRVDLIVIMPILVLATVLCGLAFFKRRQR
jgi:hypothetical protein